MSNVDFTVEKGRWKFEVIKDNNVVVFSNGKVEGSFKYPSNWANTRIFQTINSIMEQVI